MQQPIRYYITKSGDEPTVRSVKVARDEARPGDRDNLGTDRGTDAAPSPPEATGRPLGVKRLVQGAIRKRGQST